MNLERKGFSKRLSLSIESCTNSASGKLEKLLLFWYSTDEIREREKERKIKFVSVTISAVKIEKNIGLRDSRNSYRLKPEKHCIGNEKIGFKDYYWCISYKKVKYSWYIHKNHFYKVPECVV